MTKSPVNNGINNKKGRSGQNEIEFPSPKKDEDVKKRHKIINLIHSASHNDMALTLICKSRIVTIVAHL